MRIFLLIILLFFLGCEKKKEVPVVIGLDSEYSSVAENIKNGMLLAQDEDKNVKFDFIDNKGDKYITSKIDEKLIKKHTPLVIGHITSDITKSAVHLFDNTDTILFSPTASAKELAGKDDNFIRLQPIKDFNSIKNILKYMKRLSMDKINILYYYPHKTYANSLINSFLDKRNKYIKVNKIIPINEFDFKLNQIKKDVPIFIIAPTKISADIVISLKQRGFESMIFVAGSAFTKDFISLAGDYGEGVMFFSTFNPASDDKKYIKFKEHFIAKFGYSPSSFEVKGYEIAKITSQIIDKKNIKKALINHTFDGLQGKIHINKYGDTIRDTHIYIINNSIFEKVE